MKNHTFRALLTEIHRRMKARAGTASDRRAVNGLVGFIFTRAERYGILDKADAPPDPSPPAGPLAKPSRLDSPARLKARREAVESGAENPMPRLHEMTKAQLRDELQRVWNLCDEYEVPCYNGGHQMTLYGRIYRLLTRTKPRT